MNALQFVTHNTAENVFEAGSHLQGEITATYEELRALFGEPHEADQYKSDAEWNIRFGDGTYASIYNWKDGKAYCGEAGTPTEQITEWHVGGDTKRAVELVQAMLELHREMKSEAQTKDDPIAQAVGKHRDLLKSVESMHGEKYAKAVQFAYMVQRQVEVFGVLLNGARSGTPCPDFVAAKMSDAFLDLCSRVCSRYMEDTGAPDGAELKELLAWAGKIAKADDESAHLLMKTLRKGAA